MDNNLVRVWVLEDDGGCCFVYEEIYAKSNGYELSVFKTLSEFNEGYERVKSGELLQPHLFIADLNLPDGRFDNWFRAEKERGGSCIDRWSVIVVSSLTENTVLNTLFDLGIVDYLIKPFSEQELSVKSGRILKNHLVSDRWTVKDVTLSSISLQIQRGTLTSEQLTSKEFQTVSCLMGSPGLKKSRDEIMRMVWGQTAVSKNTLNVLLTKLKKKLQPLEIRLEFILPNFYQLRLDLGGQDEEEEEDLTDAVLEFWNSPLSKFKPRVG